MVVDIWYIMSNIISLRKISLRKPYRIYVLYYYLLLLLVTLLGNRSRSQVSPFWIISINNTLSPAIAIVNFVQ